MRCGIFKLRCRPAQGSGSRLVPRHQSSQMLTSVIDAVKRRRQPPAKTRPRAEKTARGLLKGPTGSGLIVHSAASAGAAVTPLIGMTRFCCASGMTRSKVMDSRPCSNEAERTSIRSSRWNLRVKLRTPMPRWM